MIQKKFIKSLRKHIVMYTHGVHPNVGGFPDTGGQNKFIVEIAKSLEALGYKITVFNRAIKTTFKNKNNETKIDHRGIEYQSKFIRTVYLKDGHTKTFVRKEDMPEHIDALTNSLLKVIKKEKTNIDLLMPHYYDGLVILSKVKLALQKQGKVIPLVWVPHSLGNLKQVNFEANIVDKRTLQSKLDNLRIKERQNLENKYLTFVDIIAVTSKRLERYVKKYKNAKNKQILYFPPGFDEESFKYRKYINTKNIEDIINKNKKKSDIVKISKEQKDLKKAKKLYKKLHKKLKTRLKKGERKSVKLSDFTIFLEISRTDRTKEKDTLIGAFKKFRVKYPDRKILFITNIKEDDPLGEYLINKAKDLDYFIYLNFPTDKEVELLYNLTDIYISASSMEGFGMSVQQASASGKPCIFSQYIPFGVEYLLGENPEKYSENSQIGLAGIKVERGKLTQDEYENEFVKAIFLLSEKKSKLAKNMSKKALGLIKDLTWDKITKSFIEKVKLS